jgi:hypothetical protein
MSRCCFAVDWLATSGGLLAGYNALAPLEAGQEDKFYLNICTSNSGFGVHVPKKSTFMTVTEL